MRLNDLVARLEEDVPARSDVPSASQYEQAVRDAVDDFSRRTSMQRITTLAIVSGTATYNLPADFIRLIQLASLTEPDSISNPGGGGVIMSAAGMIPVTASFEERFTIAGLTITFFPTPAYTLARDLWYAAGHVLSEDEDYPDMTADVAGVMLLKAQSIALTQQANKAAQQAWSYQIGDERISKEKLSSEMRLQAQKLGGQYLEAVRSQVGVVASRARY